MGTRRKLPTPRLSDSQAPRGSAPKSPIEGARISEFSMGGEQFLVISIPQARGCDVQGLTEAERAVAEAVLDGRSNAEIASARGTSTRTVANQIAAMFQKLGVGSRAELVALLEAEGGGRPS